MKINIHSINPTLVLQLEGNEAWLKTIYDLYQRPGAGAKPLTGSIRLHEEAAGSYLVTGSLAMTAVMPCDLCGQTLPCDLEISIDVRYLPAVTNMLEREKNLSRSDLDAYFIEDEEIDLETLLNDSINDALPTRLVHDQKDGKSCVERDQSLGGDETGDKVWTSKDEKDSPFAALKDVKLRN